MKTLEEKFMEMFEEKEKKVLELEEELLGFKKKYVYNNVDNSLIIDSSDYNFEFLDESITLYTGKLDYSSYINKAVSHFMYNILKLKVYNYDKLNDVLNGDDINKLMLYKNGYGSSILNINMYDIIGKCKINDTSYYLNRDMEMMEINDYTFYNTKEILLNELRPHVIDHINDNLDNIKTIFNQLIEVNKDD